MFETNEPLLKQSLDKVDSSNMQLPDFQRGWVWDDDRIRGLLASISRGFPIGAIMTLEAGGEIKLKSRPVEGVHVNGTSVPESYLLDGQQRLTSLYQALLHPDAVETSERSRGQKVKRWYYIDMQAALDKSIDREDAIRSVPEDKRVTGDFGRETVLDLSSPELEYAQHMFPTEQLMNAMDWAFSYSNYWSNSELTHPEGDASKFIQDFKSAVLNSFTEYKLPEIRLGKGTLKEAVCTVFEKVNTGGEPLNVFELATASFAMDDSFSLRDDWAERRNRLYSQSSVLRGFAGDQFLQVVALLKTQEDRRRAEGEGRTGRQLPAVACRKREILDLNLSDYRMWADSVEEALVQAARFLRSQFVFGQYNVPYNTQLVPLAALFVELGTDANSALAKERLEQWYWSGVFGELYGGAVETQFARDLVEVAVFVRTGTVPNSINEASFIPQRLISLRTRNSAAYKGLYALQMKHGARDWMSGDQLAFATYDNAHIDIHHIFPVAWCRNNDVPNLLYDSIINKTPVDAHTNRVMGGQAPSGYLRRLEPHVPEGSLDNLLSSHWIERDHLDRDSFGEFFVVRGQHMLDLIGTAMGRDLGDGQEVFQQALTDAGVTSMYIEEEPEYDEVGESEREETEAA